MCYPVDISVTIDKPETVSVYQVKKTDKDAFKKKASWRFRDLKIIDGKDATKVKEAVIFDKHNVSMGRSQILKGGTKNMTQKY